MSASNNFITRPVLSTVCSLLIVIVGLIAIPILPIENLPDIAPPTVKVQATYVGADAVAAGSRLLVALPKHYMERDAATARPHINGALGRGALFAQATAAGADIVAGANVIVLQNTDNDNKPLVH